NDATIAVRRTANLFPLTAAEHIGDVRSESTPNRRMALPQRLRTLRHCHIEAVMPTRSGRESPADRGRTSCERVHRRDVLGGLIHEYWADVA
ncbi:MAG TPA: hypothetical protein VNN79_05830, partial [Actinomycetota bacterium]|nr:hypothetical protein [Actinomycetota bacterium]